ncbi:MAG: ABC transporter ATP-binding protein [Phycisphaerales bacterium]
MPALIIAKNLHRTYRLGKVPVPVLRGVDFEVRSGEWVAVLGASGSGKSTLLHLLGGLDRPDRGGGEIHYRDRNLANFTNGELNRYRNESVGFVFQFYHLLPELSVLENTLAPAMVRFGRFRYRANRAEVTRRATELLDLFGLGHRLKHRPAELSGGERQRVAIARALLNEPDALLADEPTGNLDAETGGQILEVIAGTHRKGQTIVMVTHDASIAAKADRVVELRNGNLR